MRFKKGREATRVAAIYVLAAGVWILVSDAVVGWLFPAADNALQTIKGLLFVGVTASTLWVLVDRWSRRIRVEARHAASAEQMLSQVVRTVPVGVVLLNDDAAITFMNPAAEELFGIATSDAVGLRIEELPVAEGPTERVSIGELLCTGETEGLKLRAADGRIARAVFARAAEVEPGQPGSGWVVALTDVTDASEARERALRLARGYRFLSEASVAMVRRDGRHAMLEELCRLAVDKGGYSGACAIFMDGKGEESVDGVYLRAHQSPSAVPPELMTAFDVNGELVHTMVEGEILVWPDLSEAGQPWSESPEVARHGSAASMAVSEPGGIVCALMLLDREVGAFDADQLAVLKLVRSTLAFAVERGALDRQRLMAEDALERSERSYRELFEKHPQPMWVYDLETLGYLAVNDAAVAKYGWSRDEFLSMTIADIRPPDEVGLLKDNVRRVSEEYEDAGIWTHIDKSGRHFPVHVFSHTIDWNGRAAELVLVQEVARVS